MPTIAKERLLTDITKAKLNWTPLESWIYNISDTQRSNLLGVAIDHADLARIMSAPPAAAAAPVSLPVAVDWRNHAGRNFVSPVKNQGGCGSCVSFGTVGVVEAMGAIERNVSFLDLSEADLHFCSSHGANCGGWWPTNALDDVKSRGVVGEADFPYNSAFHGGATSCVAVPNHAGKATKITSWSALATMNDRKSWIANHGPVDAVFHVYDDFFGYGSGVYSHVSGGEAGYHCVQVVGYSDTEHCWMCKNSWGDSWGDHGFFKIAYGQCGIDDTSNDKDTSGNTLRFPMWGATGVVLPPPPAPHILTIDADINSDGRLEVFATSVTDHTVWNIWQTVPHAGPWSNFSMLGGQVKQLVSAMNSDGRLEIFGIGMDNALWHNWQTHPHAGPWSGWFSLGGGVKEISAARNSDGRLEVFAIGMDDALWDIWQTAPSGGWSGWVSLGGKVKHIASALNSDGRLEVFGIGMDDALWDVWQTVPHGGPWSGWVSLGGKVKQICAACNSDGRLEVFGIGMDDGAYDIWQTKPHAGPWSAWNSLGGKVKQLSIELNSDGRLELFGIGMDDGLWNTWQTVAHGGPWSGWNSLGGKVKRISSARNSDGRLEVLGIGMDDGLWSNWQTHPHAGPWSGWAKLA